jgi:hypothetical protein
MSILSIGGTDTNQFNNLSVRDLLQARAYYHIFLTQKRNVVGTAIGRYLIRDFKFSATKPMNSSVHENSWPCVLVLINEWQAEETLVAEKASDLIPKTLYLPDGRPVPVCIVEAPRVLTDAGETGTAASRLYPPSVISGGYPLISRTQGQDHFASVGCLVSDGHKVYALTNRHVVGEAGTPAFARLGSELEFIGVSAPKQLEKVQFGDVYPGWPNDDLYLNADIGLIDVANLNQWKTEVYGIGPLNELLDLNIHNINLRLIGTDVRGYGAGSGAIAGRVAALFYRYRSVGGVEYIADYLIGPQTTKAAKAKDEDAFVVRHGDSGTLLLAETTDGPRPFAVVWGTHIFQDGGDTLYHGYALATGLSNMCRLLDVDLVRGWNIDQPYTWGKTGHFKIAARACELVSDSKLLKLLMANQKNIGYVDDDLQSGDVVTGKFTHDFVPLADVADIIWRTTRKSDESNHFADIDETDLRVYDGKSLLELSFENDANIDVDIWSDFDQQMDVVKPNYHANRQTGEDELRPRAGALPFRVWQMYRQMILSLQTGKLDEFICAGGTMAHYVGDACQPLHISYLHHGRDASESAVHADYETKLIDNKMEELFSGVNAIKTKVKASELITPDGRAAAKLVLTLMNETVERLPPLEVVEVWDASRGRGKWDAMWQKLGPRTIQNIASGSHVMAVLWQSAWKHGGGADISGRDLVEIAPEDLQGLYNKSNFVPSFELTDPRFKKELSR